MLLKYITLVKSTCETEREEDAAPGLREEVVAGKGPDRAPNSSLIYSSKG